MWPLSAPPLPSLQRGEHQPSGVSHFRDLERLARRCSGAAAIAVAATLTFPARPAARRSLLARDVA